MGWMGTSCLSSLGPHTWALSPLSLPGLSLVLAGFTFPKLVAGSTPLLHSAHGSSSSSVLGFYLISRVPLAHISTLFWFTVFHSIGCCLSLSCSYPPCGHLLLGQNIQCVLQCRKCLPHYSAVLLVANTGLSPEFLAHSWGSWTLQSDEFLVRSDRAGGPWQHQAGNGARKTR